MPASPRSRPTHSRTALREAAEHDTAGVDVETLATKTDLASGIAALEARLYRAMLMQTAVTVGLLGLLLGALRRLG